MKKPVFKKKFLTVMWSCVYVILLFTFCISGVLIFHSVYYRSIFVSGQSMMPTLLGGDGNPSISGTANFGIINPTKKAKNAIKRFDIITTYFPWEAEDYKSYEDNEKQDFLKPDGYHPDYKIKRVIGLPGETLQYIKNKDLLIITLTDGSKIAYSDQSFTNDCKEDDLNKTVKNIQKFPFKRNFPDREDFTITLELNEEDQDRLRENPSLGDKVFFAMGDNWCKGGSLDCSTVKGGPKYLYANNIVGVLVAIEGTCTIKIDGEKKCVHRHYEIPRVF